MNLVVYVTQTPLQFDVASGDECPRLLGLSSGSIQDWQIASSSSLSNEMGKDINVCQPKFGRLYQNGNKAWCSKHRSVGEWILVDLGVVSQVFIQMLHQN